MVVTHENLMKEGNSPKEKKSTVEYEKKENDILPFTLLNKIVLIVFNRTGKNCEETSLKIGRASCRERV